MQFVYHYKTASGIVEAKNMRLARIKIAVYLGISLNDKSLVVSRI